MSARPDVVWLAECDSTNDEAWRRAGAGFARGRAPAVRAVGADAQSAGRGRMGRGWCSPPGCGLYLSWLSRFALPPASAAAVPLLAGVAVAETLASLGVAVRLKWPNDVLLAGRKIGGVLCEARVAERWAEEGGACWPAVVGVGINRRTPEAGWPEGVPAAALDEVLSPVPDAQALALSLLARLERWEEAVAAAGIAPVLEAWRGWGPPIGAVVRQDGTTGTYLGLAEDGALRMKEVEGRVRTIHAGDVDLIDERERS